MSETIAVPKGARLALIVGGLAAIVFGVAILVWPTKVAVAITAIIAVYAIIAGVVYIALGFFSRGVRLGGRIGHIVLGLLFVIAGIYAFSSLNQSAAFLAIFLTVLVGVLWIVEGVVSLTTLGEAGSKLFTIVFSILSIVAGFILLSSPLWGAAFLWWFFGIALVVLGILNALRGVFSRKA